MAQRSRSNSSKNKRKRKKKKVEEEEPEGGDLAAWEVEYQSMCFCVFQNGSDRNSARIYCTTYILIKDTENTMARDSRRCVWCDIMEKSKKRTEKT